MPEAKPLLRCDPNLLVTGLLHPHPKPAMLVEPTRVMQSVFEAEGVINGACELEHRGVQFERLVWEAKVPQGQRQEASMSDAGILAHELDPERRTCTVVEVGERVLATVASPTKIPSIEARQAFQKESLHENAGIA